MYTDSAMQMLFSHSHFASYSFKKKFLNGTNLIEQKLVISSRVPGTVQGQVGWGHTQPGLVFDMEVGGLTCGEGIGAS